MKKSWIDWLNGSYHRKEDAPQRDDLQAACEDDVTLSHLNRLFLFESYEEKLLMMVLVLAEEKAKLQEKLIEYNTVRRCPVICVKCDVSTERCEFAVNNDLAEMMKARTDASHPDKNEYKAYYGFDRSHPVEEDDNGGQAT